MKNYTFFIWILIMLISCQQKEPIISGRIKGVEGSGNYIYLVKPETFQDIATSYLGTMVDSALIKKDGSFEFKNIHVNQESMLLEIAVQPTGKPFNFLETDDVAHANYMPIYWQAGEPLQIASNFNEFQKNFNLENPSEINKSLLQLRDSYQLAYQNNLDGKAWDLEEDAGLLEKEEAHVKFQKPLMEFAQNSELLMPALVATRWVSVEQDYERVPEFLIGQCHQWTNSYGHHPWVQQLCDLGDANSLPVLVGDQFPLVELPMISGDTLNLKQILGSKVTVLDLWASWCVPCRRENKSVLVPLWDTYHDKGFQIVAYGLESSASAWEKAVVTDGADRWLHASHLEGDDTPFLKTIRVQTIPANFILDSQGIVIAKNIHGNELTRFVQNYLD